MRDVVCCAAAQLSPDFEYRRTKTWYSESPMAPNEYLDAPALLLRALWAAVCLITYFLDLARDTFELDSNVGYILFNNHLQRSWKFDVNIVRAKHNREAVRSTPLLYFTTTHICEQTFYLIGLLFAITIASKLRCASPNLSIRALVLPLYER